MMIKKNTTAGGFLKMVNAHLKEEITPLMQEMELVIDECDATQLVGYIANIKALSDTFKLLAKSSEQVGLHLLAYELEKRGNGKEVEATLNNISSGDITELKAKQFIQTMKDIQSKTFN